MLIIIFTSDYEIHGNGEGSPMKLMVEPTERMMDLFNNYNAKLTIMADVAEIIKYGEYRDVTGSDDFHYEAIADQLTQAIKSGHDVQLHLHPSFFKAKYINGSWQQHYSEYDVARIKYKRLYDIIKVCKKYLESLLRPIDQNYKCNVFRAANWSMQPSIHIIKALINNNILIDTSVFKNGIQNGLVHFNYTSAYSNLFPWPVSDNEICKIDPRGKLVEIPIYSELRSIFSFLSINRINRAIQTKLHRSGKNVNRNNSIEKQKSQSTSGILEIFKKTSIFFQKHPWKMDFNQCTGKQLVRSLKRIWKDNSFLEFDLPIVLIGHSKLFNLSNQKSLSYFLQFVADNRDRFKFGKFSDLNRTKIIKNILL